MEYDKLIYLIEDELTAAHESMDKVTEALTCWAKKQKQVTGEPLHQCISDQQVYIGKHARIWFSDDDAVLMSAKSYAEFVGPYNSRILDAFGGGCLHYCGNATHQADNFLKTRGLRAIREMLHSLSFRGLIVDSQYSPVVGLLRGGKYEVPRNLYEGRRAVCDFLCRYWQHSVTGRCNARYDRHRGGDMGQGAGAQHVGDVLHRVPACWLAMACLDAVHQFNGVLHV